jgi:coenzyme PQQ precursor peptide PqqA
MAQTAGSPQTAAVPADGLPVRTTASCGRDTQEKPMKWEKPAASDMRFGFEITMYIANR